MRQIPISQREHMDLPAYEPRCFVPEKACLTDAAQVKDLFQRLIQREVLSQEDFQKWIFDRSELEAALDQQEAVLYIRMTAQTDDLKKAEEYKQFVKDVEPVMRSMDHALNRRYIELKKDSPLNDPFYEVYDRAIESNLEIFREKNVELMTKTSLLSQEYQAICGAMTVNFNGRERTLAQMAKFLFEPDPSLRESAWRAITKRRLQDRDRLDDLFDQMLELRARIARNAGKQNYCDYQFQAKHRFDYTPEDCRQYHRTVQEEAVPVWKNILERRRIKMTL